MTSTTKRKLIGGPIKVTSVAVAAGVPLTLLYEMAPKWFEETEPGVAITGVGIIGICIIGVFFLPYMIGALKSLFSFLAKGQSKRIFVTVIVLCGVMFGLVSAVEYLYPLVQDIKIMIFGTAGSVAAGWGINSVGGAVSQPKKKEETSNG